ncbi:MAG: 4-alpha-glucanotransferase, partial [Anaerolineae bacterium]
YGDSPYQCFSAFAGNPLLISPDQLIADGFLPETAVSPPPSFPRNRVDYGATIPYKHQIFHSAFAQFQEKGSQTQQTAFQYFCTKNEAWLDDFAFFMALKDHHIDQDGGVWNTWPKGIAHRKPKAMQKWAAQLADEIVYHKFLQFLFFEQWLSLRAYANQRGIQIIGDAPIFVAFDSADVWANPDMFFLDEGGEPTVIAGVPPDYFSETGQRWGNPLYRWGKMKDDGYVWWQRRLAAIFNQVDIVRLDHFRGFEAFWRIPADEPTAVVGEWVKAPGMDFLSKMKSEFGELPIIAEDLGVITPEVEALRDAFAFPGMKILQFGFGGERNSDFLPHNFGRNSVVYTGTHDNETTTGWYGNASQGEQDHIRRYIARDGHDIAWDMIRLAYASVSHLAVVPMQDLMKLGNEARMNFPGKASGYWQWRFTPEILTQEIVWRLQELTGLYGRLPPQKDNG